MINASDKTEPAGSLPTSSPPSLSYFVAISSTSSVFAQISDTTESTGVGEFGFVLYCCTSELVQIGAVS